MGLIATGAPEEETAGKRAAGLKHVPASERLHSQTGVDVTCAAGRVEAEVEGGGARMVPAAAG